MKVPLIYLCIHGKFKEKSIGMEIEIKEAFRLLSSIYHIKKEFRYPILKELEDFNLISKTTKNKITVLKNGIDLSNTSKIYRSVGLY